MKQNIAIIGFKDEYKKQVATMLSSQLDMFMFDMFDCLRFDDLPRTLDETLQICGSKQVRKHESSLVNYSTDFENTVLVCDGGVVDLNKNWEVLHKKSLVIYVHCSVSHVQKVLATQTYAGRFEKRFFKISESKLKKRIAIAKKNSDIVVNATGKSVFRTTADIIREIKKYYSEVV